MILSKTTKDIIVTYKKNFLQYGHSRKKVNKKMTPFIFSVHKGNHIIDLIKTSKMLELAKMALKQKAEKGGTFLFVGTNKITSSLIKTEAQECQSFYINSHWPSGLITNWETMNNRISFLRNLEAQDQLKKEQCAPFCGILNMKSLPSAVIFANQLKNDSGINECKRFAIPSICIVDTNCNPDFITYPIPANDDSVISIRYILKELRGSIQKGYASKLNKE